MTSLRRLCAFLTSKPGVVAMCLLAVVVMVVWTIPEAHAQADTFPYLGLGDDQEKAMRIGFAVQWAMFGGFSGSQGNALFYLALTAAMVGMLLIIAQPKNRSPGVVVPWFMILTILLFAPYQSRLLYYPVDGKGDCVADKKSKLNNGKMETSGVCGFTPQIVAAHVGTTMAVIMTDIFRSMGFQDLVKQSLTNQAIDNHEAMTVEPNSPGADVLDKWQKNADCGPYQMLPANLSQSDYDEATGGKNGAGGSGKAAANAPISFSKAMDMLRDSATQPGMVKNARVIMLPESEGEAGSLGWPTGQGGVWPVYESGVAKLYEETISKAPGTLTTGEKVKAIRAKMSDESGGDWASAQPSHMGFYVTGVNDHSSLTAKRQAQDYPNITTNQFGQPMNGQVFSTGGMQDFLKANPSVANMPVGVGSAKPKADGLGEFEVNKEFGQDCSQQADESFYNMLSAQLGGQVGVDKNLAVQAFRKAIEKGDQTIDTADLVKNGGSLGQLFADGDKTWTGNDIARKLSGQWTSDYQRQKANAPMNAATNGAANNAANTGTGSGGSAVGNSWVGWLLEQMGWGAAGLAGYLSGLLSAIVLNIIMTLINLAIMLMIVVTPLMFIMGLLIPANAAGMIILTTMGMLVLKMVPVTIVVVNFLVSLARDMSWNATSGMKAFGSDGIIMFAAAGLYTSIIGLTLFMMFKMGDPGNIAALRNLDGAAKKIGETGIQVGKALGKLALVPAAGAAGTMIAGSFGASKAAAGMAGAANDAMKASGLAGEAQKMKAAAEEKLMEEDAAKKKQFDLNQSLSDAFVDDQEPGMVKSFLDDDDIGYIGETNLDVERKRFDERNAEQEPIGEFDGLDRNKFFDPDKDMPQRGTNPPQQQQAKPTANEQMKALQDAQRAENNRLHAERRAAQGQLESQNPVQQQQSNAGGPSGNAPESKDKDKNKEAQDESKTQKKIDPATATVQQIEEASKNKERRDDRDFGEPNANIAEKDPHWERFGDILEKANANLIAELKNLRMVRDGVSDEDADKHIVLNSAKSVEGAVDQWMQTAKDAGQKLDRSEAERWVKQGITVGNAAGMFEKNRAYLDQIGVKRNQDGTYDQGSARSLGRMEGRRSALKGFMEASGGAGGSIPVLGPLIKEMMNEGREAHIRSMAAHAQGGWKQWSRDKGDADNSKLLKKHVGYAGEAEAYRNQSIQAMYSNSVQSARDGAAKGVEEFMARVRSGKADATGAFGSDDLRAASRIDAINKASNVTQAALTIKNAKIDMQGNRSVGLTPAVLNALAERTSTNNAKDDVSKLFERGYMMQSKLEKATRMQDGQPRTSFRDGGTVGRFARNSVDDVAYSGFLKNFTGRIQGEINNGISQHIMAFEDMKRQLITSNSIKRGRNRKLNDFLKSKDDDLDKYADAIMNRTKAE